MATSTIPAAIDGLLALCNAQAVTGGTLADVFVYDGPPKEDPSEQRQLYIGHSEEVSGTVYAVEGTQEFLSMGGPRKETFAIRCSAVARSGDTVIKTERDRAFSIMAAVENLIRQNVVGADMTLGGAVLMSNVSGDVKVVQLQTTNGAYVQVTFYVQCLARI
jgi:hypothetical protein